MNSYIYTHRRFLCVPLNEKGIIDLEYDKNTEDNLYISFPENEYKYMMSDTNLFDTINIKCNLLIDDFEEDTIYYENISAVENILNPHKKVIPVFINALSIAKKHKTFLEVIL